MNDCIIHLENVKKTFNDVLLFEDVCFSMGKQENISVCGASGSGKTTLSNILCLLDVPTAGKVFWQNTDVSKLNSSKVSRLRAKMFGYIFQQCNLIPELNVLENIIFPRRILSQITKEDLEFAKSLLEYVGLGNLGGRDVATLSGGERQRVAVVRALINRPEIIIADEPTGSLDEKSAALVMDMIMDLCRRQHSSLLLITHNNKFADMTQNMYVLSNTRLEKVK